MDEGKKSFRVNIISEDESRAIMPSLSSGISKTIEIAQESLKNNLSKLIGDLSEVFAEIPNPGPYVARQFEITANLSADGGLELVGKFSAGVSGGIKIVFEREDR